MDYLGHIIAGHLKHSKAVIIIKHVSRDDSLIPQEFDSRRAFAETILLVNNGTVHSIMKREHT